MFIATLIATKRLAKGELSSAQDRLGAAGCQVSKAFDIIDGRVADIFFDGDPDQARKTLKNLGRTIDIAVQSAANRRKKLLISDMDSTMITVECIDELASYAGIKDKIAEITERAMQGELDFEQALRGRVALLAGLETSAIKKCLDEKVKIMPGAKTLVRTMAGLGAKTLLVSGGFTKFAEPVAKAIGFESFEANILEEDGAKLSGKLSGEIVDSTRKAKLLSDTAHSANISLEECLAVGDGANDISMIELAGLGIAFHAKPIAANAADVAIQHGDLSALLYIQGIPSSEWVTD